MTEHRKQPESSLEDEALEIDGSHGEGGGQILRSSLALSLVTGRPVRIVRIRAGRPRPGLMRQHLTALLAAAEISEAKIEGGEIGSKSLVFTPGSVRPGDYAFQVGTAGSATLVLQTVLPALALCDQPSRLSVEGGTHNPWAPPFEFLQHAYLPLLNRMGPQVTAELNRYGFHPAGGGKISVEITPSQQLKPLQLLNRSEPVRPAVLAMVANLPGRIARRELDYIRKRSKWPDEVFQLRQIAESNGPGNCLQIRLESDSVTEVFTGFGRVGIPADHVARDTLREARSYLAMGVPVGPYLADQLLLPMGIGAWQGTGGGRFRTVPLSRHSETHRELLQQFLGIDIGVCRDDSGAVELHVEREPLAPVE